jgi:hypothetical protein
MKANCNHAWFRIHPALLTGFTLWGNAFAGNPLELGLNLRTADPSAPVWPDGKMYLYTAHDEECRVATTAGVSGIRRRNSCI